MLSLQNALLLLAVVCGLALECYKGSKYLKGQSIGTEKMTCEKETDYCYNMTADLTQFNALSRSGCSTSRCKASFCLSLINCTHINFWVAHKVFRRIAEMMGNR
ncbi:hypothetical protein Q1695_011576 [Nippostrongylus brasiliensis]|nr:hypothetical protein Q1695_011576 [Nippostrongylus brasiliensis]